MNGFETDLKRAVCSFRFFIAAALQFLILHNGGFSSTLYQMSVPVICTLPFAADWIDEYKGGFVRFALIRSTRRGYILGKFFACGLAGGGVEVLAAWGYVSSQAEELACSYLLLFLSAMLWSEMAALLAALSDSKYLAYGGSFVLCYFLVILYERYWPAAYCLYPFEWLAPQHVWLLDETGVVLMLSGLILTLMLCYYLVLERKIDHV